MNHPPLCSLRGGEEDNGFAEVPAQSLAVSTRQRLCAESVRSWYGSAPLHALKDNGRQRRQPAARLPFNTLPSALRPEGELSPLPPQKYPLELFLSIADHNLVYIACRRPSGG